MKRKQKGNKMASLRTVVGRYRNELREGIAYIAFYKKGRSWEAEAFYLDGNDELEPEDVEELSKIYMTDKDTMIINGRYDVCFDYESTIDDMIGILKTIYMDEARLLFDFEPFRKNFDESITDTPSVTAHELDTNKLMRGTFGEKLKRTLHEFGTLSKSSDEWKLSAAKWGMFKTTIKQLYGVEFFYTREDDYFGACTEDEKTWLFKEPITKE